MKHPRYGDTARMTVIASAPREGRIQRQIRRALIAANGKPLKTRDLINWAFPGAREFWHYKSIYRAAPRYAVKDGRIWKPKP
jgi:hypothetical protein